ncbi:unnamed protein product [Moneuplotes crassus]|uniref:Uncharacterized protein n=1 Tax=Euplotes crassus TaxID=5936 RepID=A0AAD1XTK8_EUPCR|nr:unnamed protein product [Moneuplotes crassus]
MRELQIRIREVKSLRSRNFTIFEKHCKTMILHLMLWDCRYGEDEKYLKNADFEDGRCFRKENTIYISRVRLPLFEKMIKILLKSKNKIELINNIDAPIYRQTIAIKRLITKMSLMKIVKISSFSITSKNFAHILTKGISLEELEVSRCIISGPIIKPGASERASKLKTVRITCRITLSHKILLELKDYDNILVNMCQWLSKNVRKEAFFYLYGIEYTTCKELKDKYCLRRVKPSKNLRYDYYQGE